MKAWQHLHNGDASGVFTGLEGIAEGFKSLEIFRILVVSTAFTAGDEPAAEKLLVKMMRWSAVSACSSSHVQSASVSAGVRNSSRILSGGRAMVAVAASASSAGYCVLQGGCQAA